ncbi:MAG: glycosyltransferase [Spirochaetaceae bacterium]|nr:MAG: glycosyltransferase [Spirochaetaceae bacterium]
MLIETGSNERVLLSYLPTGGGHLSAARALQVELTALGVESRLFNGLVPRSRFQKWVIEDGYRFVSNTHPSLWIAIYELSKHPALMSVNTWLMALLSARHVAAAIEEHGITRIVNLHFLLNRSIQLAMRILRARAKRSGAAFRVIPTVTVVTDPLTTHPVWFYRNRFPTVVFSERVKRFAVERCGRAPGRIHLLPPILGARFASPIPQEEIGPLRASRGFDLHRPLILVAGGGEGLVDGERYIAAIRRAKLDVQIAFVAGKNESLRLAAAAVARRYPGQTTVVYGFVDFMFDLMSMADLIVTKGGPATILEALALGKPPIVTQYIYGQERGNKDFIVDNRVGYFARGTRRMVRLVRELLNDPAKLDRIRARIDALGLRHGTADIARFALTIGRSRRA